MNEQAPQPFPQVVSVRGPITVYDQAPEALKTLAAAHNAEIATTAERFREIVVAAYERFDRDASRHDDLEDAADPTPLEAFEREVRAVLRVDRGTCADALVQMAGTYAASGDTGTANGLLLAAQHLAPRPATGATGVGAAAPVLQP